MKELTELRVRRPEAVAEAAAARARPASPLGPHGQVLIVAADHPARGMVGAGERGQAMADRGELLRRLATALERPGVTGVLGTPDVIDDLLLLGALDGKFVVGSMNRGGIGGAAFELDDRLSELVRVVKCLLGCGSVDALPYLGPRLPVVAVGDEMVDRSFRWSDCGRSVFCGPPRFGWVSRSLLELAARGGRIVDVWAGSERLAGVVSGGSSAAGPSALRRW